MKRVNYHMMHWNVTEFMIAVETFFALLAKCDLICENRT